MEYLVVGTDIRLVDLKTISIKYVKGGVVMVKELPRSSYLPCTQNSGCDQFASHAIFVFTKGEEGDLHCKLCPQHLEMLDGVRELEFR